MANHGETRQNPQNFLPDCEECAGLCCVIPSIHSPEGIRLKTVNRVCEHLRMDPSGTGHECSIYDSRKWKWYRVCKGYSCAGAWQAVTRYARTVEWILGDGSVSVLTIEAFAFFTEMAWFLETNADFPDEPGWFGSRDRSNFIKDCRTTYARFLETSEIVFPDGTPTDVRSLREWYHEEYRTKFATILGIPVFRKRKGPRPSKPRTPDGDHDVL